MMIRIVPKLKNRSLPRCVCGDPTNRRAAVTPVVDDRAARNEAIWTTRGTEWSFRGIRPRLGIYRGVLDQRPAFPVLS